MTYPTEYDALIAISGGREGTQNILSQMRRVFSAEDPTQGSTEVQNSTYRDLEKLSCDNVKHIIQYINEYMRLAAKTGRFFAGPELSEKFWLKMPGDLGNRIKTAFEAKHPGLTVGVFPRIIFAHKFLEQECKDAAFKRSLKDLSFCNQIPIPGYYQKAGSKRIGIRQSKTYKGKPHNTHARIEKRKHLLRNKKCKCYFARDCPNDKRNVKRVAIFEQLEIPEDYDILSVQEGEAQSDAIYSISEGEDDILEVQHSVQTLQINSLYMLGLEDGGYRQQIKLTDAQSNCLHQWKHNEKILAPQSTTCTCNSCTCNSILSYELDTGAEKLYHLV
ncbi:uncharacterized protein LOC122034311 [Zingiber officinale]|uniref:uncharacterized protein LOC122034311 n=1 Tax=Zingiber officinale TaxID=94328 RepID=UPI001C4B19CD|nr:uncharacterized protein LOC122034311 [Zingiber officinale]